MIHQDYLASLLRPLGVYDLREGTVNRGELEAYGVRLDHMAGELEDRMPSAAFGPTPETDMSCWKSFSSSWLAKPYRSMASSRTLR